MGPRPKNPIDRKSRRDTLPPRTLINSANAGTCIRVCTRNPSRRKETHFTKEGRTEDLCRNFLAYKSLKFGTNRPSLLASCRAQKQTGNADVSTLWRANTGTASFRSSLKKGEFVARRATKTDIFYIYYFIFVFGKASLSNKVPRNAVGGWLQGQARRWEYAQSHVGFPLIFVCFHFFFLYMEFFQ